MDELNKAKDEVYNSVNNRFSMFSIYGLFKTILLRNELLDRGHKVCGPEKEDEYIKIITENNNDDLKILEEYLAVVNDFNILKCWVDKTEDFLTKLETSSNKKEELITFLYSLQ